MESTPPDLGPTQPVPAAPMSLGGRLLNVLAVPAEVFDQVKAGVSSPVNWLVPALMLSVAGWLAAWLIFSQPAIQQQVREVTAQAIEQQIQKAHLPPAQAEQTRAMGEKYAGISQQVAACVSPVFAGFATPFLWGLILWLVGTKALKGSFPYLKAVEAAGLANVILVLETVVKALLIISLGTVFASPSAALLVKGFDPQKTSHALLMLANPFTFWLLGVRASGLARLSGASYAKAAAWVFGLWAAYTGVTVGFGLAVKAVFGG